MTYPKLYVVIYKPIYGGNYQHWALYIDHELNPLVIEVIGEHPNFEPLISSVRAEEFPGRSFLSRHFLGVVCQDDIPGIIEVVKGVPLDNETVQWDCQDYVLEILDALEEAFYLSGDDEEYSEARVLLGEMRGPVL